MENLTPATIDRILELAPARTIEVGGFTYIDKDKSCKRFDYIFRIQAGNQCALFEADGGNWKLQAIQNVREWLQNRMRGSLAPGVPEIPVIA